MAFKLRSQNPIGTPLTWTEMDDNLSFLLVKMSGSNLQLTGSTKIKGDLTISSSLLVNSTSRFQDTASTTFVIPTLNKTYDLGKSTHYWKTAYIDNIVATTMTASLISGSVTYALSASYASSSYSSSYSATASIATSASYASSSYSSSYSTSASYASSSYSSSYSTSASYASSSYSSSYALTASYIPGYVPSTGNPIITIPISSRLGNNNAVSEIIAATAATTADFFHLLQTSATSISMPGNRVYITKGLINPNHAVGYNVIPNFQAKLVGEFGTATGAMTFDDEDLTLCNNTFRLQGLRFLNQAGSSLGGFTYQDFNFNYYKTASAGDSTLSGGGCQLETEWMSITIFTTDAITNGYLIPMYINNTGDIVTIERLTLFLQEI